MKVKIALSLLAAMVLGGCDAGMSGLTEGEGDENAGATATSTQRVVLHNQGAACLNCHGRGYSNDSDSHDDHDHEDDGDSDEEFTSGATVYTTLHDNIFADDYRIRLVLEYTGEIVQYSSGRGTGNSHTDYAYSLNGFTAQVVDGSGKVVNASLANSHGADRLDCNQCHTASGSGGAPGRIVSYDYYHSSTTSGTTTSTTGTTSTTTNTTGTTSTTGTTGTTGTTTSTTGTTTSTNTTGTTGTTTTNTNTTSSSGVSFASNVMPVLENKCKGCHGSSGRLRVTDAASTYSNITSNGFVDAANPAGSLLLTKASGNGHGGGMVIDTASAEYGTLRDWIAQGALNN